MISSRLLGFRLCVLSLVLLFSTLMTACESLSYYGQAVAGQWQIVTTKQDIDELIADTTTDDLLRQRLQLVQHARQFSRQQLLLPVGGSYSEYVDLARDYVVWNVYAAPELSLTAKQWCFPIAGCVAYRGYFDKQNAMKKAKALKREGLEVYVGGVRAYSTLGWFDDPLLNTFINDSELALVNLLIHELAHQKCYVKDDTAFNESFATAVADIGLTRWLQGDDGQHKLEKPLALEHFQLQRRENRQLNKLLAQAREELLLVYTDDSLSDDEKRVQKAMLLDALQQQYTDMKQQMKGAVRFDSWMATMNNAKLANVANYHYFVPAFMQLYKDVAEDIPAFYASVDRLADMPKAERHQALEHLMSR